MPKQSTETAAAAPVMFAELGQPLQISRWQQGSDD
jgi:hypothetical protein